MWIILDIFFMQGGEYDNLIIYMFFVFQALPSIPGEGGDLYASSNLQRFFSPLYPLYYLGDMITKWVIHAPGRQIVTLHVSLWCTCSPTSPPLCPLYPGHSHQANHPCSWTSGSCPSCKSPWHILPSVMWGHGHQVAHPHGVGYRDSHPAWSLLCTFSIHFLPLYPLYYTLAMFANMCFDSLRLAAW